VRCNDQVTAHAGGAATAGKELTQRHKDHKEQVRPASRLGVSVSLREAVEPGSWVSLAQLLLRCRSDHCKTRNALKFGAVDGDHTVASRARSGCNDQIVGTDGLTGALHCSPKLRMNACGLQVKRENGKETEEILNKLRPFLAYRAIYGTMHAMQQLARGDRREGKGFIAPAEAVPPGAVQRASPWASRCPDRWPGPRSRGRGCRARHYAAGNRRTGRSRATTSRTRRRTAR